MWFPYSRSGQSRLALPTHIVPYGTGTRWVQVALQRCPILYIGACNYSLTNLHCAIFTDYDLAPSVRFFMRQQLRLELHFPVRHYVV